MDNTCKMLLPSYANEGLDNSGGKPYKHECLSLAAEVTPLVAGLSKLIGAAVSIVSSGFFLQTVLPTQRLCLYTYRLFTPFY